MSRNLSVLQRATRADVRRSPFPHIVLKDALPEALYGALAASFPPLDALEVDLERNNKRWNYVASQVSENPAIPELWRDFIGYHAGREFFHEIVELFYPDIEALYGGRFPSLAGMKALRTGVRLRDDYGAADVLMDAMFGGNTPVAKASSVRGAHVDQGDKLFSGLFYMRPEGYDSVGGDLTILRFKPKIARSEDRFALFEGPKVDAAHVELIETIPYDRNTLVLFVNSLDSLHGVTVRQPTDKSRLFVNLVGEVDPPLYALRRDGKPAAYRPGVRPAHARPARRGIFASLARRVRA